jgi:hypothetical protein
MSEQQDVVTPMDSASNVSGKKKRPGKAQRAANRSSVISASSSLGEASVPNANRFASKAFSTPVPQPGKYPVVFPTGAGEPTRDSFIAIDGCSLDACFKDIGDQYINSARYAEFSSHAGIGDDDFKRDMVISSLLGVCQQIVHAHTNLGLPLGDFSSVASTEVYNPSAVRQIIHQFGEFSVESLGTRFLFMSYDNEVKALIRTAKYIKDNENANVSDALRSHWLPVVANDPRTGFILAEKMAKHFAKYGLTIDTLSLARKMFSEAPPGFPGVKAVLPADEKDIFDVFFKPFQTAADFVKMVADGGRKAVKVLGLAFNAGFVDFRCVPKVEFPSLIQPWLMKKATMLKFFRCGSGAVEKAVACGSSSQLSEVGGPDGVTVVKTLVALSAPEFSLLACFPASAVMQETLEKRVIVTTSLSVAVRATEFLQLDWL